jgi:hypothetical protein
LPRSFRAGIQSVDRGQYEAAKVLGMSYGQTMRRIVLPQMVRSILPPMSNETITLVKDTSLIYVLALNDLLRAARGIVQRDFTTTPFIVAAAFYLLMTLVLTWGFQRWRNAMPNMTSDAPMIEARDIRKRLRRQPGAARRLAAVAPGRSGGGDRAVGLGQKHLSALPEPSGNHRQRPYRHRGRNAGHHRRSRPLRLRADAECAASAARPAWCSSTSTCLGTSRCWRT